MKQYKALVLDVDGTLVGRDFTISPRVKKAILKIKNQVSISLCSGRTYGSFKVYVDQLGLWAPQIGDGGATIFDSLGNILYQKRLKEKIGRQIIKMFLGEKRPFIVSTGGKYYFESSLADVVLSAFGVSRLNSLTDAPHLIETSNIVFWEKLLLSKITVLGLKSEDDFKKLEKVLQPFIQEVNLARSATGFIGSGSCDITYKTVSKLSALAQLSKLSGISLKETIVVGDGYNDFPLLLAGGLKVAMGNAVEDLKQVADFVAPAVEEDGVAVVIEKFLR